MKALRKCFASIVFALLLAPGISPAQQPGDIYFRQAPLSARGIAIGEASVADVRSASGAVWNPASLVFLESISADITTAAAMNGTVAQAGVSLPFVVQERFGVAVAAYSGLAGRSDWSAGDASVYGGSISVGTRVSPTFSVGALYNMTTGSSGGANVTAHNFGFGMMYSALPSFSYGAAFTGIGSGIIYHQNDTVRALEREGSIPRSITLGATWRYPTKHDRVVFTYFLTGQKIIGVEQVVYRMGLEVIPWKFLVLRGGVVSGPVTSIGRFGFGIRTPIVEIDYGLSSSLAEPRLHTITMSFPVFTR